MFSLICINSKLNYNPGVPITITFFSANCTNNTPQRFSLRERNHTITFILDNCIW